MIAVFGARPAGDSPAAGHPVTLRSCHFTEWSRHRYCSNRLTLYVCSAYTCSMTAVIDTPTREDLRLLGRGDRMRLMQEMISEERQRFARFADLLDVMDAEGDHVADGHRRVANLLVALANTSHAEANAKVKAMRTLRLLPEVRERLRDGEFGVAQVQSLAGAYGNPRVRDFLAVIEDQLVDWAELPHDEFDARVREFGRLADADGAEQRDRARHERRGLHLSQSGDGFHGTFGCGNTQGVVISRVLDHFARKEFDADWAEAKARVGDRVTGNDLARSAEQRKIDALQAICLTAAATTPGLQPPNPLVNLVMDTRTCDEIIDDAVTGIRPAPDLTDIASRRCHTSDGVRIPDADALAAMLQGHIRRLVVNDQGVTIDLGRRKRLFTGNARDAVMLRSVRCVWAGCNMPASKCEADHTTPWAHNGETNADSGAPGCDHHNRWKTKGFTTHTDDRGRWNTLRPDGTNINSPPAT